MIYPNNLKLNEKHHYCPDYTLPESAFTESVQTGIALWQFVKKASKRLYFLVQLKRANLSVFH